MIKLVYYIVYYIGDIKVKLRNSANILFACLLKTCLFDYNLKSNLPNEELNGRGNLTVQR